MIYVVRVALIPTLATMADIESKLWLTGFDKKYRSSDHEGNLRTED